MRATRELLLAGAEPAPFAVPALGGAEVTIRALTSPQAAEIRAMQVRGIKISGKALEAALDSSTAGGIRPAKPRGSASTAADAMSMDMGDLVVGQAKALVAAAAYGLVEPALSIDELEASPNQAAVEQIGREVMERSGLGRGQATAIAGFRGDEPGPVDAPAAPGGDAPGADPG